MLLAKTLETPPLPLLVPEGVFDAFGWCASDTLVWKRPNRAWSLDTPLDGSDPARMVFVFHEGADTTFLPKELARLHAFGLGLTNEWALAPYAIDDATDELFARRARPRDSFWLAADNLNALFWGLHDWAHFHNHGAFAPAQRAWTEVQCDASALAWLWRNRELLELTAEVWDAARLQALAVCAGRFEEAEVTGLTASATGLDVLRAESLKKLADGARVS